ncbi:MAG TPA: uracil-DNA glycosylase [Nocardioidaceae bacterium]|nr:uracil-DNA glycosylase [Nocardioidaceae bacterium]
MDNRDERAAYVGTALPHPITGELFASPVPPGSGWPGDPAAPETPVAGDAAAVAALAAGTRSLADLDAAVSVCRACPRLVGWRERVAREKRAAFAGEPYWGRPIAGWGSSQPRVLLVGLAPAANGGNRTGRMFTGDRSGDWLFASLHRVGLASLPTSRYAGDGQRLPHTRMIAPVRCAPPDNRPSTLERDTCARWLDAELGLILPSVRVAVCLGAYAWAALLGALVRRGAAVPRPRPRFGHGVRVTVDISGPAGSAAPRRLQLLGCFHPSQQNTFTGRLTESMLDAVLAQAATLAQLPAGR